MDSFAQNVFTIIGFGTELFFVETVVYIRRKVGEVGMRLIDADKLIEVFEEQDHYLWGLPDKENPHKRAKQGQLNWCINMVHERPTVPYDMKWNPECEDCLPEDINDCIRCRQR